jgi:hypothetical protein
MCSLLKMVYQCTKTCRGLCKSDCILCFNIVYELVLIYVVIIHEFQPLDLLTDDWLVCVDKRSNYTEHSPSSDASSSSASQQIPHILRNAKFYYRIHKSLSLSSAKLTQSTHTYPVSLKFILILSSNLYLIFQMISFLQVSPPTLCMHFSFLLVVLHAPPISFYLIWLSSGEEYKPWSSSWCNCLQPPVTLCSLCVVAKDKMGRAWRTYDKSENTWSEETTTWNAHMYLKECGARKWIGCRWLTVGAGSGERRNEPSGS